LRVRQYLYDPIDQDRDAARDLQCLSPVLHRQAEAGQKLVDTAGMVEKFERRYGKTATPK